MYDLPTVKRDQARELWEHVIAGLRELVGDQDPLLWEVRMRPDCLLAMVEHYMFRCCGFWFEDQKGPGLRVIRTMRGVPLVEDDQLTQPFKIVRWRPLACGPGRPIIPSVRHTD